MNGDMDFGALNITSSHEKAKEKIEQNRIAVSFVELISLFLHEHVNCKVAGVMHHNLNAINHIDANK